MTLKARLGYVTYLIYDSKNASGVICNPKQQQEQRETYKQASVSTVLDLTAVVAEITLEAGL